MNAIRIGRDPRQFRVKISSAQPFDSLQLKLDDFGCTSDLCLALTHEYTVDMKAKEDGSRTCGMNRGSKGGSTSRRGGAAPGGGSRMTQMGIDNSGSVSFEEMCAQVKQQRPGDFNEDRIRRRFDSLDTNHDGELSPQELDRAPRPQRK